MRNQLIGMGLLVSTFGMAQTVTPSAKMGEGLFNQKGSNSCVFCHGIGGENGNVKAAAKLTQPRTWKTWKAVGGDGAYAKDPAGFEAKLKEGLLDLIQKGAIVHNSSYKVAGFDWSKIAKFDGQMMGLTGAPSQAWLKKYKEKGVSAEIAAQSAYLYIKTLDKTSTFK